MAKVIKPSIIDKVLARFGYSKKGINSSAMIGSMYKNSTIGGVSQDVTYYSLCNAYRGWVYTCIDKIAKAVAMTDYNLYVYRNSTGGKVRNQMALKSKLKSMPKSDANVFLKSNGLKKEIITEHPFLELTKNPNDVYTRFQLWYNIMVRLELAGEVGIYMPQNRLGIPGQLWVLPATSTGKLYPVPDAKKLIGGYKYRDRDVNQTFTTDELLWINYPDPRNPFIGKSALEAQLYPYDIDFFLEKQQYNLLKNKASFGNVFSTDKELTDNQVTQLREQIDSQYAGVKESGKPLFLHSGMRSDSQLVQSAKDMMLKEVSEFARDKLISAYDMAPGNVGIIKDVNRSTAEVLDKDFTQKCIAPRVMMIEEYFESKVLPKYDDGLYMEFELQDFEDRELRNKERETNLTNFVTTINEERVRDGLDPVPWGDEPWGSFTSVQITENPKADEPPAEKHVKAVDKYDEIKWKQFDADAKRAERIIEPGIKKYFADLEKRVIGNLESGGKRITGYINGMSAQKRRRWLKDNVNRMEDINITLAIEEKEVEKYLEPAMQTIVAEMGEKWLETYAGGGEFNIQDKIASQWLGNRLKEHSQEIAKTTFDDIGAILREGFGEGQPVSKIAATLRDKFEGYDKYRANMIARTESVSSVNKSEILAAKQAGAESLMEKYWINQPGARDTHSVAGLEYGKSNAIGVDELFVVGGDSMDSPGNGRLAKENINCRCALGWKRIHQ